MTATVVKSTAEELHLTATSGGALSGSTKLEETSKLSISTAGTNVKRQNLNSDGYTQVTATWLELSGSLDFTVARDSTVQALIVPGGTAFLTVVTDASAGAMEEKGKRYEVVFANVDVTWEGPALVTGSATFDVNGGPTTVMGSA